MTKIPAGGSSRSRARARARRYLRRPAVAGLVAATLAGPGIAMAGCGASSSPPTLPRAPEASLTAPRTREVQVVVDPSDSFGTRRFRTTVATLASIVRGSREPSGAADANPGRAELRIAVRAVERHAYGPESLLAGGTIAAVPRIEQLRADKEGDYALSASRRARQRRAAKTALALGQRQANQIADRIAALEPPRASCSDVWGAISASAESFDSPDKRLLIVSDLRQNCRANIAGSLRDTQVLVVHLCGSAGACREQEHAFRRRLKSLGARDPVFARFDQLRRAAWPLVNEGS